MTAAAFKNTLISRFEESVMPVTESCCWLWLRGLDTTGYGVLKVVGRPEHLFLGSQADNIRDMMAKGRGPDSKGERNANSKITAAQAYAIRNSTLTLRELAAIYPIKKSMLSNIKLGKNWGGV